MVDDPRVRTKIYLEKYLNYANLIATDNSLTPALTKDDGLQNANYIICYGKPNYSMVKVFNMKSVDLIFAIDKPTSELRLGVRYTEHVPITICTVNKAGITGTKLAWKAEAELRRICETQPYGSLHTVDRIEDSEERLGSTVLYSTTFMLNYRRTAGVEA